MTLRALLYRCPYCGSEGTYESSGPTLCPGCGRSFREGPGGTRIVVVGPDGHRSEVPAVELVRQSDALFGGGVVWEGAEAIATMRVATREVPVRDGGSLLGFFEALGPRRKGRLRLEGDAVLFRGEEGGRDRWAYLDIRALQSSSSSVQISPAAGGVVTFRFKEASPRKWEDLLRRALRDAWSRAGRGEIGEFQPRIRLREGGR